MENRCAVCARRARFCTGNSIAIPKGDCRSGEMHSSFMTVRESVGRQSAPAPDIGGNLRSRRHPGRCRRRPRCGSTAATPADRIGAGTQQRAAMLRTGMDARAGPGDACGQSRPAAPVASMFLLRETPMRKRDSADRLRPGRYRSKRSVGTCDFGRGSRRYRRRPVGNRAAYLSGCWGPFAGSVRHALRGRHEKGRRGNAIGRSDGAARPTIAAALPLFRAGAGRKRLPGRRREHPFRDALREFFGLGAPDASLITTRIRAGSTVFWGSGRCDPQDAGPRTVTPVAASAPSNRDRARPPDRARRPSTRPENRRRFCSCRQPCAAGARRDRRARHWRRDRAPRSRHRSCRRRNSD